jgi:esterase/lipase superfamily enzyme
MSPTAFRSRFWLIAALVLVPCATVSGQTRHGTGMILDDASYEDVPMMAPLMRSNFDAMPTSASLKRFAPIPGDQGTTGTCVGWATAYAARTIIASMQNGWTEQAVITANAFSPSYLYNQLRGQSGSDPTCTRGTLIPYALELMKERGALDLNSFPFDCSRGVSIRDHEKAEPNKILEYTRLFNQGSRNKVLPVKKSLAEGKPVVIGMLVPSSFMNQRDDLWEPSYPGEEVTPYDGHALTVVGYDDDMYGGSFELMNSWGTRWGNSGFIWMKYDHFTEYVKYGFDVYAAQELPPNQPPLAGALTLKLLSGEVMAASRTGSVYRMNEIYQSDVEFEAFISNEQPAYVYAFSSDLSRKVQQLVPGDSTISPFLSNPRSNISLSGDYVFHLDERPGLDYFTVLYSVEALDLATIMAAVERGTGTYQERVLAAIGKRAVPADQIEYPSDGVSFLSLAGSGSVVPITVEIEHVGAEMGSDTRPPVLTVLDPATAEGSTSIVVQRDASEVIVLGSVHDDGGVSYVLVNGEAIELSVEGTFSIPLDFGGGETSFEIVAADQAGNRVTLAYVLEPQPLDEEPPVLAVEEPRVVKGKLRGIGIRKKLRTRNVTGTVSDPSGVGGVYVNGLAARLSDDRFEVAVPLAADQNVLTIRAVDLLGNEETGEYQILEDSESKESFRASPGFSDGDQDYVTINVYYGTDRAATGNSTPSAYYGGDRGELEYGRVAVSVPQGHSVGELESPVWWKFEFREDPASHVMLHEVLPLGRETTMDEIRGLVLQSAEKSAFVFVHGFNVSFEDAALRTGQLAYDLDFDGAPIFYSWPSDGTVSAYTRDESDVQWSWPHLYEFLSQVAENTGAERVHVIGHSMGNRAVTSALLRFARNGTGPVFDQVLLTAPDIDADVFTEQIAPVIPGAAQRVTLYASSRDRALRVSKAVHGYARAGDSGEGLVVIGGIDTIDASEIDTDMLGHSYFAQTELILKDIAAVLGRAGMPEERGLVPRLKEVLTYWLLQVAR